jgi:hypothetical protein
MAQLDRSRERERWSSPSIGYHAEQEERAILVGAWHPSSSLIWHSVHTNQQDDCILFSNGSDVRRHTLTVPSENNIKRSDVWGRQSDD